MNAQKAFAIREKKKKTIHANGNERLVGFPEICVYHVIVFSNSLNINRSTSNALSTIIEINFLSGDESSLNFNLHNIFQAVPL